MTDTTAPARCANHPRRDRVVSCGSCGDPLCKECIVPTPVGFKCPKCTGEQPAKVAPSASRRPPATPKKPRPRWLWPTVAASVAVVLLLALMVSLTQGEDNTRQYANEDTGDPAEEEGPVERMLDFPGGGNTRIGATLLVPGRGATPTAGVLLIPGFGAIDRNAVMATNTPDGAADRLSQDLNYSRPGTPDTLPRDLSDALVARGAATLRYDKRGSGQSPLPADRPLSYDDLVADATGGLDFLSQRIETAGVPLAIVGIDQGGLIALRLAADPRVKAVMLVSTWGRPLADVIGGDLVASRGADGQAASDQLHDLAARVAAGGSLPPPAEINSHLRPLFPTMQERYLGSNFGLDPVAEARKAKSKVVLVRGEKDTTVTAADSERLKAGLPPGTEEIVVPGGDHNLGNQTRRDPALMSQLAAKLVGSVTG